MATAGAAAAKPSPPSGGKRARGPHGRVVVAGLHLPTTLSVGLFHHPLSQSEPPTTTTQGRRPSPFQET